MSAISEERPTPTTSEPGCESRMSAFDLGALRALVAEHTPTDDTDAAEAILAEVRRYERHDKAVGTAVAILRVRGWVPEAAALEDSWRDYGGTDA